VHFKDSIRFINHYRLRLLFDNNIEGAFIDHCLHGFRAHDVGSGSIRMYGGEKAKKICSETWTTLEQPEIRKIIINQPTSHDAPQSPMHRHSNCGESAQTPRLLKGGMTDIAKAER
jgi:hypothetical protein